MTFDPRALARALDGDVVAGGVLAPAMGKGRLNRALRVMPSATNRDGFTVHLFNDPGDRAAALAERDRVKAALGLPAWEPSQREERTPVPRPAMLDAPRSDTSALALRLWGMAEPPGRAVTAYYGARGLDVPEAGADLVRYLPARGDNPAAVACLVRDAATDQPCGLHLTSVGPTGAKLGRKMLGRAKGGAVQLDPSGEVSGGLFLGEGVEAVLAACARGLRPAWAALSTSGLAGFPVLAGVECLTVLADHDENGAGERAARVLAERWRDAGREARVILPRVQGADFADCLAVGDTP